MRQHKSDSDIKTFHILTYTRPTTEPTDKARPHHLRYTHTTYQCCTYMNVMCTNMVKQVHFQSNEKCDFFFKSNIQAI